MPRLPVKPLRLALAVALAGAIVALPVIAQDAPESILPPGFGDPVPAPPPPPPPPPGTSPAPTPAPGPITRPLAPADETDEDEEDDEDEDLVYVLPSTPVTPLGNVGPLGVDAGGMGERAFGDADGVALSRLMRRLDAPLPSRWMSIVLRRALLSNVPTPRGGSAPDWIAERAWLLLRMGEADSARLLIQNVHPSQYTPKMFDVAMQTALALGDPGGLCPVAELAIQTDRSTGWLLARAMCAALAGEPGTASAAIEQARRTRLDGRNTIDLLLAEKVAGAGINNRRSITIEWEGVDQLTAWRYGLASAVAVEIPPALFDTVGPHVQAWRARAPFLSDADRLAAGRRAAMLGVFSSAALVDLYAGIHDRTDIAEQAGTEPAKLREAYAGASTDARMDALEDLWDEGPEAERFANLVLTARAAARMPIVEEVVDQAPRLIESMLTAGLDTRAIAWRRLASDNDRVWALLALAAPDTLVDTGRVGGFDGDETQARLLIAGLAGLGRIDAAQAEDFGANLDMDFARAGNWSNLLDQAVANRQPGTVALIAAIGMQTRSPRAIPPGHLYRIISALRRVGLEPEARMIAAEALSRA